jgi:glutamate-1-semialdehyde aminotransferase
MTWEQRAKASITHGAFTNSKRAESFVRGAYPTHVTHGNRCFLYSPEGKAYTDYICGLGSTLFGYSNREIEEAILKQLRKGITHSLPTTLEVEWAERAKEVFGFSQVRALKTGSEGCAAALRVARALTGRTIVFSEGYHGWHDEFTSLTPPALGLCQVSGLGIQRMPKTIESIGAYADVAAVIVEPVISDYSEQRFEYLRKLRKLCTRRGIVLIFDETITALRVPGLTVSRWTGIKPDILIAGKALAGGMPISMIAFSEDVSKADFFVSSTFSGETLTLAASIEVLRLVKSAEYMVDHLWEKAGVFQEMFNSFHPEIITIEGYPTRGVFRGDRISRALFFRESITAGLLFGPSFFYGYCHPTENDQVLNLCEQILGKIHRGEAGKFEHEYPVSLTSEKERE